MLGCVTIYSPQRSFLVYGIHAVDLTIQIKRKVMKSEFTEEPEATQNFEEGMKIFFKVSKIALYRLRKGRRRSAILLLCVNQRLATGD
jgi:hypothetical protein